MCLLRHTWLKAVISVKYWGNSCPSIIPFGSKIGYFRTLLSMDLYGDKRVPLQGVTLREPGLFISAGGCWNFYFYQCKTWAFLSKIFLQWNFLHFFDVICIWSQFTFRSRTSEHSLGRKKKKKKKKRGDMICQRRCNLKIGGNTELRTAGLPWVRSFYAKGRERVTPPVAWSGKLSWQTSCWYFGSGRGICCSCWT